MPPKEDKEKKDARKWPKGDEDTANKSGGKAKTKRSKGSDQDRLNNIVLLDEAPYGKVCALKRLKSGCSLARAALQELLGERLSKLVSEHRAQVISTQNTKVEMPGCW